MDQKTREELKAKYGRLIVVEIGGHMLAFRPLDKAKLANLQRDIAKASDRRVELSLNAVGFCCVYGKEHYDALANDYPLAFVGNGEDPSVLDALMRLARGNATIQIEE
jgi:hypothetical protein